MGPGTRTTGEDFQEEVESLLGPPDDNDDTAEEDEESGDKNSGT